MKTTEIPAQFEEAGTRGIQQPGGVARRFGTRLRALRHSRGWTQAQMAAIFGIDRSYISEVERGHKSISLPTMEILAMGFGLRLAELLQDV
jgi:transcriptional regulator with XRE-family HTH domain